MQNVSSCEVAEEIWSRVFAYLMESNTLILVLVDSLALRLESMGRHQTTLVYGDVYAPFKCSDFTHVRFDSDVSEVLRITLLNAERPNVKEIQP